MIIPDINLLIYAHNDQDSRHIIAKTWWESRLNGDKPVGLPWVVTSGFIRLMTHPRVLNRPMTAAQATDTVRAWLQQPVVRIVTPGEDFTDIFLNYLNTIGTAGNLTTDAQIASIVVENQATLFSNDSDFERFPGLRWKNPLKT